MVLNIKESLIKIKLKVLGFLNGKMGKFILENGLIIKWKDKVLLNLKMVLFIKDNLKMI